MFLPGDFVNYVFGNPVSLTVVSRFILKYDAIFFTSMPISFLSRVLNQISTAEGKMAAFQGGILVREKATGEIVGSVGISGAAGDEDEYCAL